MKAYMQLIADPSQYINAGDFADLQQIPLPSGFQWVEGDPPDNAAPYVQFDPLQQLEQIITQGQQDMANNPLPEDIQKQIFDLEPFIQNYYRRGARPLIQASIQGFVIADDDRTDVTADQRNLVTQLRNQMLEVFNGL